MTTYSASVAIFLTNNFSVTKLVGSSYATLEAAQSAAASAAQTLQNQTLATGLLQVAPIFVTIDLGDGSNMPIRLRTGNIIAFWPTAGES